MLALTLLTEAVACGDAGPRTQHLCYALATSRRRHVTPADRKHAREALVALAAQDQIDAALRPMLAADPDPEVRSEYWCRTDIDVEDFAAYLHGERSATALATLIRAPRMTADLLAVVATEMTKTLATAIVENRRTDTVVAVLPAAVTFLARSWSASATDPLARKSRIGRTAGDVVDAATRLGDYATVVVADASLPAVVRLAALANDTVSAPEVDHWFGALLDQLEAGFTVLDDRPPLRHEERQLALDALATVAGRGDLLPTTLTQFEERVDDSELLRYLAFDWRKLVQANSVTDDEAEPSPVTVKVNGRTVGDWLYDDNLTTAALTTLWAQLDADAKEHWYEEVAAANVCDAALYRVVAADVDQDTTSLLTTPGKQQWLLDEDLFRELVAWNAQTMLLAADNRYTSLTADQVQTLLRWTVEALMAGTVQGADVMPLWVQAARHPHFPPELFRNVPARAVASMVGAGAAPAPLLDQLLTALEGIAADPNVGARVLDELLTDEVPLGATLEAIAQGVA